MNTKLTRLYRALILTIITTCLFISAHVAKASHNERSRSDQKSQTDQRKSTYSSVETYYTEKQYLPVYLPFELGSDSLKTYGYNFLEHTQTNSGESSEDIHLNISYNEVSCNYSEENFCTIMPLEFKEANKIISLGLSPDNQELVEVTLQGDGYTRIIGVQSSRSFDTKAKAPEPNQVAYYLVHNSNETESFTFVTSLYKSIENVEALANSSIVPSVKSIKIRDLKVLDHYVK